MGGPRVGRAVRATVEHLHALGQGQRVRLRLADAGPVEVRVNQMEYVPETCLRVQLTTDDSGDGSRYVVEATCDGGTWTGATARQYDPVGDAWSTLGSVEDVRPMETFVTVKSTDMEAQAGTGGPGGRF